MVGHVKFYHKYAKFYFLGSLAKHRVEHGNVLHSGRLHPYSRILENTLAYFAAMTREKNNFVTSAFGYIKEDFKTS